MSLTNEIRKHKCLKDTDSGGEKMSKEREQAEQETIAIIETLRQLNKAA